MMTKCEMKGCTYNSEGSCDFNQPMFRVIDYSDLPFVICANWEPNSDKMKKMGMI